MVACKETTKIGTTHSELLTAELLTTPEPKGTRKGPAYRNLGGSESCQEGYLEKG